MNELLKRHKEMKDYVASLETHSNSYLDDIERYCRGVEDGSESKERLKNICQNYFPSMTKPSIMPICLCIKYIKCKREIESWCKKKEDE